MPSAAFRTNEFCNSEEDDKEVDGESSFDTGKVDLHSRAEQRGGQIARQPKWVGSVPPKKTDQ